MIDDATRIDIVGSIGNEFVVVRLVNNYRTRKVTLLLIVEYVLPGREGMEYKVRTLEAPVPWNRLDGGYPSSIREKALKRLSAKGIHSNA